jgi:hypothetical protein
VANRRAHKADPLTQKDPALGRASKASPQRASGLGDAADLLGVLVRLGLDGPSRLISRAQGYLGNALVGVDHLLQAVPYGLSFYPEDARRQGPSD